MRMSNPMSDDLSAWRRAPVDSEGLSDEVSDALNAMSNRILKVLVSLAVLTSLSLALNAFLYIQMRSSEKALQLEISTVRSDLDSMESGFTYVERALDDIDGRVNDVDGRVDDVDGRVDEIFDYFWKYLWC